MQTNWANTLQVDFNGQTVDGWRLPQTLPVNGLAYNYDHSFDGSTDRGYNISALGSAYPGSTGSEMANLFYYTLGNNGAFDLDGNQRDSGDYGLKNTGPFENLLGYYYFSVTENTENPLLARQLDFDTGDQSNNLKTNSNCALAVRPGDVEPAPTPPVANAGQEQVVFDEVTLNGSGSYDPYNENLSYDWHLGYRGNPDFDKYATGETPIVSNLVKGIYDVTLMVTNESGYTDEDLVFVAAAGSCFCTASTMHIQSIATEAIKGTKGSKFCQATVTVFDDCGNPVSGASVTGTFTFPDLSSETSSPVTTNNEGVAVILTTEQFKKPSCEFCVNNVADTLTYDPNDNVVETYECE
jgi:hypothetical protein